MKTLNSGLFRYKAFKEITECMKRVVGFNKHVWSSIVIAKLF